MNQKTPLFDAHVAAGAKIVDFAGWDMPLHYGSQVEEHHKVRTDAGMFDVSHMLAIDVAGEASHDFLHGLIANNVDKLKTPGKALYSCMLNPTGGVIDDLIVYFFSLDNYRIVVNAGTADKDMAWMRAQAATLGTRAPTLTPRRDLCILAIQGPKACEKFWQAYPATRAATETLKPFNAASQGEWLIARTGYTGEDGFEIMIPATDAQAMWDKLLAAGVSPVGLGARDTLRLEAGMALYGQDLDEQTTPLAAGLAWTVDLNAPRDFVGKAALIERPPARQTLGLLLTDRGVLRPHQTVHTAQGEGEITSGTFSPTLNNSIALARLPMDVAVGDVVEVAVRDKRLKARVVKAPFVRNGKPLI